VSSTGSVYQRKDGQWAAAVVVGGRKVVRYGKTEREARQRLRELLAADHNRTLAAPTKLTLAEWAERWLRALEVDRRPSTMRDYQQALAPIVARLGKVRLDKLAPMALDLTFTDIRRAGIGTRSIQQGYTVLGTCLGAAVRLGVIAANPLDRVQKPKHVAQERTRWTDVEAQRFIMVAAGAPHRYAPLLLLLIGGGLRISEALGLAWNDVDLSAGTVSITKALVWAGKRASVQPTKSKAGTRTITLPSVTRVAFARLPRPLDGSTPIFTTAGGLPPGATAFRRTMRAVCRQAEVPVIRIHDLRHSHASLLVAAGVDLATVSKRLGHSKISTTANIYTHAIRPDSAAVEAFERAIR
jgi:integrase